MEVKIVGIGEIVVDLLYPHNLASLENEVFVPSVGGSVTNFIIYLSLLNEPCALIGKIGKDFWGNFVMEKLSACPTLNLSGVVIDPNNPTTIVLVSNSTSSTPHFFPYRYADKFLLKQEINWSIIKEAQLIHTSGFALSRNPLRETILEVIKSAHNLGKLISIDFNYCPKSWKQKKEALELLKELKPLTTYFKISQESASHLLGNYTREELINEIMQIGFPVTLFSMGKDGVIGRKEEECFYTIPPPVDKIKDTIGAGDAFWAGFIWGQLKKQDITNSLSTANKLANKILNYIGSFPSS